jgi:hypothetical protein
MMSEAFCDGLSPDTLRMYGSQRTTPTLT